MTMLLTVFELRTQLSCACLRSCICVPIDSDLSMWVSHGVSAWSCLSICGQKHILLYYKLLSLYLFLLH